MMKTFITLLSVSPILGFPVLPQSRIPASLFVAKDLSDGPFGEVDLDIERAKDCAEHFGKCSVKEMEKLRNELQKERMKTFVFGETNAPEDSLKHHMLEEELSLQLSLLQDQTPPATLFPEVEEPMIELPHLKDGTASSAAANVVEMEQKIFQLEEMFEEGTLESLAFCGLIALAFVVPQLLN